MTFEEEFRDYFSSHSFKDIYKYFRENYNLTKTKVNNLINEYGLHKTKEDSLRLREQTNLRNNGCLGRKHKLIPYEEIYQYYIVDNMTKLEIKDKLKGKYGIDIINNSIKEYNLVKSKELIAEHRKKVSLEKYGTEHPRQSSIVQEKQRQTCIERYGVDNPQKDISVKNKVKQTCLERYGVENAFQCREIQEKQQTTCLTRYGVKNVFQSEEIKSKIRQNLMRKYNVLWASQLDSIKFKSAMSWKLVDRTKLRERKNKPV